MNVPDNFDQWQAHERDRERQLAKRPVCDCCGHPIQEDHAYKINAETICPDCLEDHFRVEIDDFE